MSVDWDSGIVSFFVEQEGPAAGNAVDPGLIDAHQSALHQAQMQFFVAWDSVNYVDESTNILQASGMESVDIQTRQLQKTTVDIVLSNSDGRFDPLNASSPLFAFLTHTDQKCYINIGYNGVYAKVGTFWVDEIIPSESEENVTLKLKDRGAKLDEKHINYGPVANVLTSTVAVAILQAAGLTAADYNVETGSTLCVYASATDATPFGELQQLSIAEGGRCYIDVDGTVQFTNQQTHRALLVASKVTYYRSQMAYDISHALKKQDLVTRLILQYEDRLSTVTPEVVFSLKTPAVIPAAQTFDFNDALGNPATVFGYGILKLKLFGMDFTQWERFLPISFTDVTAITATVPTTNSKPPDTLPGFSSDLYYDLETDDSVSYLTLWNFSAASVTVSQLDVSGVPARAVSPYAVVADDLEAQNVPGVGVIEQTISNAYLPTTDLAKQRAYDLLAFRASLRTPVDIPSMDGAPYLHPMDTFTVVDDSVNPPVTSVVIVLENQWSFELGSGYTCSLQTGVAGGTAPTLASTYRGPSGQFVNFLTPVADSNLVWNWGADAHALFWNLGEWG